MTDRQATDLPREVTIIFPMSWAVIRPQPDQPSQEPFSALFQAVVTAKPSEPTLDSRLLDILDDMQAKFDQIDFIGTISKSIHHIDSDHPYLIVQDDEVRTKKVTVIYASGITRYSPGDELGASGINRATQKKLIDALRELIESRIVGWEAG